jgi:nucleoside triphosphate pyrophosphatase
LENASRKAAAVSAERSGDDRAVLGVDTVVSVGPRIYDKPQDPAQARATLVALSGRAHTVISGVCLIHRGRARTASTQTMVEFRELRETLIEWYLAGGEWRDRAGGYAIQGRGAALVRRVAGDYLNVVGLPLVTLLDLAPWLLEDLDG